MTELVDSVKGLPDTTLILIVIIGIIFLIREIIKFLNNAILKVGGRLASAFEGLQKVISDGTEVDKQQTSKIEALQDEQKKIVVDVAEIKSHALTLVKEIAELRKLVVNSESAALKEIKSLLSDISSEIKTIEESINT